MSDNKKVIDYYKNVIKKYKTIKLIMSDYAIDKFATEDGSHISDLCLDVEENMVVAEGFVHDSRGKTKISFTLKDVIDKINKDFDDIYN